MGRHLTAVFTALLLVLVFGCNRPIPDSTQAAAPPPNSEPRADGKREIRITGLVQAVRSFKVVVPQIQGQFSNMTLTRMIPNGSQVKEGDLVATFDPAQQIDAAREAQAKFEDLGHQVEQKAAENRTNSEKRMVDLRTAEGELAKAELDLQKGAVISEIEKLQAEARAAGARIRVASLKESMAARTKAEAAGLRILELQRDRQKIAMQRAESNIQKLEIHAPIGGMVVHELTRRANTLGKAQEGDQMYRGYPLLSIFDPSEMQVFCRINEPDIMALLAGTPATARLDAYPELVLPVRFVSASPVASSALDTPIKVFVAVFRIEKPDPHLLPDLSASVVLEVSGSTTPSSGGAK